MFPFIWLAQLLESVTGVILGFMYTMKSHRLSQVDVLGQKHLDYLSMRQHSESNLLTKKRKENRSISIFYIHFYFRVLAEFFCFVFVVFLNGKEKTNSGYRKIKIFKDCFYPAGNIIII